jgi:hypothetical protein
MQLMMIITWCSLAFFVTAQHEMNGAVSRCVVAALAMSGRCNGDGDVVGRALLAQKYLGR